MFSGYLFNDVLSGDCRKPSSYFVLGEYQGKVLYFNRLLRICRSSMNNPGYVVKRKKNAYLSKNVALKVVVVSSLPRGNVVFASRGLVQNVSMYWAKRKSVAMNVTQIMWKVLN